MLEVTINLIPRGYGTPKCKAVVRITNDGTGSVTRGNYQYTIFKANRLEIFRLKAFRRGELKNFPRKSRGSLELLKRILNQEKL